MNVEEARRLCASCGADVTHHQSHKNRRGQYFCAACHQAARRSSSDATDRERKRRCVCCGAEVARGAYHRNRYGEYICRTCRGKGKRSSRRGAIQRQLRFLEREIASARSELRQMGTNVTLILIGVGFGLVLFVARWLFR
jgi:hypothetical protein